MDGFRIGQVRGIDIRLNWSVIIIGVLVTWSLAEVVFPESLDAAHTEPEYWVAAAITAALFLAALLAHELGHSVVALSHDVEVSGITLWMFGGVATLESEPKTPRAALKIALAGPGVSAAIGVLALAVAPFFGGVTEVALLWFGFMNLVLMLFNLLPALPLDGGRVYQAWLWHKTSDRGAATQRAAVVGLRIGAGLVVVGLVEALLGGFVGGLWLVMIGLFIREAARAEAHQEKIAGPLASMSVSEVMTRDPVVVSGHMTIEQFVADMFLGGRHAAYPVVDDAGSVIGLISLNDVRKLSASRGDKLTVSEVASDLSEVMVLAPSQPITDLLRSLSGRDDSRMLVFDDAELVGIVSPSDIARLVSVLDLTRAVTS